VAALRLDRLRRLEQGDVLLHPREHVVLAPDVGEPGLDVVREVGLDTALRQEPEDGHELADGDDEEQHHLRDERQRLNQQRRRLEQRDHRRAAGHLAEHDRDDRDPEQPLGDARDAVPVPRPEAALVPARRPAEDLLGPEPVVLRAHLADPQVHLAQQLDAGEDEDPDLRGGDLVARVEHAALGLDLQVLVPHQQAEEQRQQPEELGPVPEGQGFAGAPELPGRRRPVLLLRLRGCGRHRALLGLGHGFTRHFALMVNESVMSPNWLLRDS
jgi:hypothetical protein